MNAILKQTSKDKIAVISIIGSGIILAIVFISMIAFYMTLPPLLPIFNRLPWGYARFGTKMQLLIPLLITTLFCVTNVFIAEKLYGKKPLLSRFLVITSLALSLFTCIFMFQVIRIVL